MAPRLGSRSGFSWQLPYWICLVTVDKELPTIHMVTFHPQEGPHSMLHEEEFFDAIDAALDKMEKEDKVASGAQSERALAQSPRPSLDASKPSFRLAAEIQSVVEEQIALADMSGTNLAGGWMLIAEDGDMKVFKREQEEDGMVIDPIKAIHTVRGITGHELCHHFWDPEVRMEWETTLESSRVVEWLSKDAMVTYQVHKRVWPATQRDSLFWSTIRHCPSEDDEGPDYWIVANHSTEHDECPVSSCPLASLTPGMHPLADR